MAVSIAQIWTEEVDPVALTGFTRTILAAEERPANQLILEQWFPNRQDADLDYVIENADSLDFTEAATFRAWNTESRIGRRAGYTRKSGKMPPISRKLPIQEYDHLRMRNAPDERFRNISERDAEKLLLSLRVRHEIARMDALVHGEVRINEDGLTGFAIEFDRPAGNVAAGSDWSDAVAGTPLTDELTVKQQAADAGYVIDAVLMSTVEASNLLRSEEYRNAYGSFRAASRLSPRQRDEVRAEFELPRIVTYDAQVRDTNDDLRRVLPAGTVVYLPDAPVGGTLWGRPASADLPAINAPRDEGGPVAYVGLSIDPMTRWTVVDAIGVPVMNLGEAVFVRTGVRG